MAQSVDAMPVARTRCVSERTLHQPPLLTRHRSTSPFSRKPTQSCGSSFLRNHSSPMSRLPKRTMRMKEKGDLECSLA